MLCAALLFATACGTAPAQEQSATPDSSTPTIRFLLRGTASGMDRVLDALYAQMDDDHRWQLDFTFVDSGDYAQQLARSLTAHDNYDFVFDAPWQSLAMQTEQKNYKNLKTTSQPGIPRPASRLFRRIPGSQHDKRRAVCHSVHQHLLRCTGYFLPQGPIANAGPAL